MDRFELKNARALAARYIEDSVRPGDSVVDATMGNGGDTLFLCGLVGSQGRVYAFDIQHEALERTREKLESQGFLERTVFSLEGHENMQKTIHEPVQAVMFNLGWLPGGDHTRTTQTDTTLQALESACELLKPGGIITVCVYPGHEEGQRERDAVHMFCQKLSVRHWNVLCHSFINASDSTPLLYLIQKNYVQPKNG